MNPLPVIIFLKNFLSSSHINWIELNFTHLRIGCDHKSVVPLQDLDSLIHHLKVKGYYNNELLIVYHLHTYDCKHQTHSNLPNYHLLNEIKSIFIINYPTRVFPIIRG